MTKEFVTAAYPSEPTIPHQYPAGYATPQIPEQNATPPLSTEEIDMRRDQFQELSLRQVVTAIVGLFTGDGTAFDQLKTWAEDLAANISGLLESIVAGLHNTFIVGNIIEILSGKEDGDTHDLGSAVNGWISDIRTTIDNVVSALFGWIGSGFSHDDAHQALTDQREAVAQLSSAVQALVNNQNNQAVNGVSAIVDFTQLADSASLPAAFTTTYSLTGTSTIGLSSGHTQQTVVQNADRDLIALYNVLPSTTDYQMVGCAFSSAPEWGNGSNASYNYLFTRMNSAGTSYVYAKLGKYSIELGYSVSGAKTVMTTMTSGFSFKSNAVYWLAAGTVGGTRVFQVIEGKEPLITWTEVGTSSQLGSGFRYTGFGFHMDVNTWGIRNVGRVTAFAFSDNQPPTVVGSGSRMYRASTSNVGVSSGNNLLATSFFDTQDEATTDITQDRTNGKFTVSLAGWYQVTIVSAVSGNFPTTFQWLLYKNGSAYKFLPGNNGMRGVTAVGGNQLPIAVGASGLVFLSAGDYVQMGYNANVSAGSCFVGDAAGQGTYFEIALVNRSLA